MYTWFMPERLYLFYQNDTVMSANPIWFPDAKLVHPCNPLRFEVHSTLKSSCQRAYFNMENLWMAEADTPGGIRKPVIGSGNDSEKRENVKPNKINYYGSTKPDHARSGSISPQHGKSNIIICDD